MMSIQPFSNSLQTIFDSKLPYLVLGKGPSFDLYNDEIFSHYNVVAINHTMSGILANIGHIVDLEVLEQLSPVELVGVESLCVPWIPHIRTKYFFSSNVVFRPGNYTLKDYVNSIDILQDYEERGRLYSYNLNMFRGHKFRAGFSCISARTFSAAVVIRLLAKHGAGDIYTLGVDGGSQYSSSFSSIEEETKLNTYHSNFDSQFTEIAMTRSQYPVRITNLRNPGPIKIYVGCTADQCLAFEVLKYSIERNCSVEVQVLDLQHAMSKAKPELLSVQMGMQQGRTPFSFQRFAIPEIQNYHGRAIYLDSDMLVLDDISRLWNYEMSNYGLLSTYVHDKSENKKASFAVMLMDCSKLDWHLSEIASNVQRGDFTYDELMYDMACIGKTSASISPDWNSLDSFTEGRTSLIHFTNMNTQPWLNIFHIHGDKWISMLIDALKADKISYETVKREVNRGNVRPSIIYQIENSVVNADQVPLKVIRMDYTLFTPKHRRNNPLIKKITFGFRRRAQFLSNVARRLKNRLERI